MGQAYASICGSEEEVEIAYEEGGRELEELRRLDAEASEAALERMEILARFALRNAEQMPSYTSSGGSHLHVDLLPVPIFSSSASAHSDNDGPDISL